MRECPTCGRLYDDGLAVCPDDKAALVAMGAADPLLGQMTGSYKLVRRIGRGGMGAVYVGQHPAIGSSVAVKVLHRKYAADPDIVERFFNEARAVNLIGHENIVPIFDYGHLADRTPWFVMELLLGQPLSALCGKPHEAAEIVPIFLQIARALGAAHAAGIVHRDLKPENVFLVDSAQGPLVKVLDFGIAKLTTLPGTVHTDTGAVLGSAPYMSPEQAAGDGARISARSDIYSLGVLLFELACGRRPFEATTWGDLLLAHRTQAPPHPDTPLAPVILRCLEKNPEDRFASMDEVAQALTQPKALRKRRRRWPIPVAAAGAIAAIGLLFLPRSKPSPPIVIAKAAPIVTPISVASPPLPPVVVPKAPVPKKPAPHGPHYKIPERVGDGMIDVEP